MQIALADIEAIWRESWITAPDGANTFNVELQNRWLTARAANKAGSLASISHSGHSQSYALPSADTQTTVYIERAHLDALKLYERIRSQLGVSINEAGELAVYNEGLARFADLPTEFESDYSQVTRC